MKDFHFDDLIFLVVVSNDMNLINFSRGFYCYLHRGYELGILKFIYTTFCRVDL